MADISLLSRIIAGAQRNVDLTTNTPVVLSIKVGGGTNTELTKAILDNLITLQNGSDIAASLHHHDGRYFTESELGSSTSSSGSDLIGDDNTYTNFTPSAATIKGAFAGIDSALAGTADEKVGITASDTTPGYLAAKVTVDNGTNSTNPLEESIVNPGANEELRIRFDQSKVDHGSIAGLGDDDHTIYTKADGTRAFTAAQSMGGFKLTNVADPTVAQDAVTKAYVDSLIDGRSWKIAAVAATTAALPAVTYNNGAGTLTADANGALPAQDGVTLVASDRLLVKDQTSGFQNGIYVVTQIGTAGTPFILTRTTDANTATELTAAAVFVMQGTANGDKQFAQNADAITLGTTALVWAVTSANSFSGHDMIGLSGGQISVDLASDGGMESSNPGNAAGQLQLKLDGATLSKSASGVKVADLGIANAQISNSAAIAYSKLNLATSIVNADINASAAIAYSKLNLATSIVNADINASAAIAYSKLALSNSIVAADITAQAVTKAKLHTDVADQVTITGGNDAALAVQHSPAVKLVMVAGEAMAANTSFLVRMAVNGETAGRVYKASQDATSSDLFYVIGVAHSTVAVSAADNVTVTMFGSYTLGSSDTAFGGTDIGKAVFLTAAGAFSITAPTTTNYAVVRVGIVRTTTSILLNGIQVVGVN